jgi:hypothetical protein
LASILPFAASACTELIAAEGDACSALNFNGSGLISLAVGGGAGVSLRITPSIIGILLLTFYFLF